MTAAKKWSSNLVDLLNDLEVELSSSVNPLELRDIAEQEDCSSAIAFCDQTAPSEILKFAIETKCMHFVQTSAISLAKEVQVSNLMLTNPNQFLKDPVNSILNPTGDINFNPKMVFQKEFSEISSKYDLLEDVEIALSEVSRSKSFIYDAQSVTDELVSNAVFHGFQDVENRQSEMLEGNSGELILAVDEKQLLIACRDPHGTLDPERLFKRIHLCYTSELSEQMNMGKGGAGIGSFLVHNIGTSYFVGINENKETVICCILPLGMSNKKRQKVSKNLHYFFLKETAK